MSAVNTRNQDRSSSQGSKTICIPFESEGHYRRCLEETSACREHMESIAQRHPELFSPGFEQGFIFKGTSHSTKQDIDLRRIKLGASGDTFQLRPSFLMPCMIGRTDDLAKALYLRQWGVPCDAVAHIFGKDSSFWYRVSLSPGRPSVVGSTVKSKAKLTPHIVADEKHTRLKGEKVYVPTTVASGGILGVLSRRSFPLPSQRDFPGEVVGRRRALCPIPRTFPGMTMEDVGETGVAPRHAAVAPILEELRRAGLDPVGARLGLGS